MFKEGGGYFLFLIPISYVLVPYIYYYLTLFIIIIAWCVWLHWMSDGMVQATYEMCIYISVINICMCMCVCECMYVFMYGCMYVCVYMNARVCMYGWMDVWMDVSLCICVWEKIENICFNTVRGLNVDLDVSSSM